MSLPISLTGMRPSGSLHLGHYVGFLRSILRFQREYESYIMIADGQALTDNFDSPDLVRQYVYELVKDCLAVGLDPSLSTIFVQSQVPELTELTFYYMNLVTVSRLARNPTMKAEIQQKGLEDVLPVGFFCYPISQAADITAFGSPGSTIAVPVGEDQLPMIELTNEIVRKFNRIYGNDCLQEAKAHLSSLPRLVGTDGKNKASKSLNNAIFLKDEADVIRKKVFSMYTDPKHIRAEDPGKVEENVVFEYLLAFHPDPKEVISLQRKYQKGGLGDTTLKSILHEVLCGILMPIQEKRKALSDSTVMEALYMGTQKARAKAQCTLGRVREAMKLVYPEIRG